MSQTDRRAITCKAHAKINLALHVTGQRVDRFHLLDSLVVFAALGDDISVRPADTLSVTIEGPFAAGLGAGNDNLVLQAARAFGNRRGAAITLTKKLPVASGIGGGSADAAATLRALATLWDVPLPPADTILKLGADVPVCLRRGLTRMRGIGEALESLGPTPRLHMLLVNPNVGLSTATVFNALPSKLNPPLIDPMPSPQEHAEWLNWLAAQRNDLQAPAIAALPLIGDILAALQAQAGCDLARMSGSGATCFALFADAQSRDAAANALRLARPDWWVAATDQAEA